MQETLAEARHRYATRDSLERAERMITEIGLGCTREESVAIAHEADAAMGDRLVADRRPRRCGGRSSPTTSTGREAGPMARTVGHAKAFLR